MESKETSTQLCRSSYSRHEYQGCCVSVVNPTEIYPKLSICINTNGTNMPVKRPRRKLLWSFWVPALWCISPLESCMRSCLSAFMPHRSNLSAMNNKLTDAVSYNLSLSNYICKKENRGMNMECLV